VGEGGRREEGGIIMDIGNEERPRSKISSIIICLVFFSNPGTKYHVATRVLDSRARAPTILALKKIGEIWNSVSCFARDVSRIGD
jgi:hypothetical protein